MGRPFSLKELVESLRAENKSPVRTVAGPRSMVAVTGPSRAEAVSPGDSVLLPFQLEMRTTLTDFIQVEFRGLKAQAEALHGRVRDNS